MDNPDASLTADLSTYVSLVSERTGIITKLYFCQMPPVQGNAQYGIEAGTVLGITPAQASTIMEWIQCGEPNN